MLAAKKYAEAVVAFEAGLLLDPTDAVCQQGLQRSKVWYNVGIISVSLCIETVELLLQSSLLQLPILYKLLLLFDLFLGLLLIRGALTVVILLV